MLIKFRGKQKIVAKWWKMPEYRGKDAIIADGAVRSGKTLSMSLGFVIWACSSFRSGTFAMCGKTVTSLRRNVTMPLIRLLRGMGFVCEERISHSFIDITFLGMTNRFYLFGGRDESSAALIQGITLSGVPQPIWCAPRTTATSSPR